MRKSDVAPQLQPYLTQVAGQPHVWAMRAPPTPRRLPPGSTIGTPMAQASEALARLHGAMAYWSNPDLLTRTLVRREAVQSSQIEGTRTELDELLTYEVTRSDDGMPADVRTTQHYVEALQHGLDAIRADGRQVLDCELIKRMHAILMQDEPVPKGIYRDRQAWIGSGRIEDATFVPSPPDLIDASMQDLEENMLQYAPREDEQYSISVLAQIAIAHAQFETIHPFSDGNGRTGRILMPLILAAEGMPPLYLSGMLMRHRAGYYAALRQVQLKGDWKSWIDMVSRAVIEAAQETLALADDLRGMAAGWAGLTADYRRDSVARRLPERLLEYPVVTVGSVADILDVSIPAASKGVNALVELGILTIRDGRKWGRAFLADAVLERLNRAPA